MARVRCGFFDWFNVRHEHFASRVSFDSVTNNSFILFWFCCHNQTSWSSLWLSLLEQFACVVKHKSVTIVNIFNVYSVLCLCLFQSSLCASSFMIVFIQFCIFVYCINTSVYVVASSSLDWTVRLVVCTTCVVLATFACVFFAFVFAGVCLQVMGIIVLRM